MEVEWKEMGRYLAINCQQDELKEDGLTVWCPVRTGTSQHQEVMKPDQQGSKKDKQDSGLISMI